MSDLDNFLKSILSELGINLDGDLEEQAFGEAETTEAAADPDERFPVYVNQTELEIVGEALNLYAQAIEATEGGIRDADDVYDLSDAVTIELGRI